jgi:hypothetical protein
MRSIKTFLGASFLALAISTAAHGQEGRPFRDSWFWGIKGGVTTYGGANVLNPTQAGNSAAAPVVGADWLITRTNGGLYVSYSQALFSTSGVVQNGPTAADSGFRVVDVSGMRQFELAAMAFPGSFVRWHPYVGFGFSFKYVGDAVARGPFTTQKQQDFATATVSDAKAGIGPLFIGGAQYRMKRMSAFGQLLVTSVGRDFILSNGHTMSLSTEFGLRYNIGSSIDEH